MSDELAQARRRHAAAQAVHRVTGAYPRSGAARDARVELQAAQVEQLAAEADEPGRYNVVERLAGPFAANLALLLRRRGMEARELAERLGLDVRHVRRLRAGAVAPTVVEIPRLARALGVRPEQLAWTDTERLAAEVKP